ncbi:PepSY-associated TM helix domain-containing protein [Endozoicomonadaceae bacterium StTr2]
MQVSNAVAGQKPVNKKRGSNKHIRWIRTLHVYISMLMLLIMLFFTVTGLTLNHRDWLPDAPPTVLNELPLPETLQNPQAWEDDPLGHAEQVRRWLNQHHGLTGNQISYDWQPEEQLLVIDVKRPGGYTLAEVLPEDGLVVLEHQEYGIAAVLNDLHMGRYSGALWRAFIDASALLMLLFTLTGLWLVIPQKKRRQRLLLLSSCGGVVMAAGYALIVMN